MISVAVPVAVHPDRSAKSVVGSRADARAAPPDEPGGRRVDLAQQVAARGVVRGKHVPTAGRPPGRGEENST